MCQCAIANMQQVATRDGKPQTQFSKDREIIPYIEQNWEAMTTMPRRLTQSWYSTVQRSLVKDVNTLFTYEEHPEHGSMYGLFNQDLRQIKPNYEIMSKTGALRLTEDGYTQGEYYQWAGVHLITFVEYLLVVVPYTLALLLFFSLALNLFCPLSAVQLTHPQWGKYCAICVFIAFCFACQTKQTTHMCVCVCALYFLSVSFSFAHVYCTLRSRRFSQFKQSQRKLIVIIRFCGSFFRTVTHKHTLSQIHTHTHKHAHIRADYQANKNTKTQL